jgi:hypothetical protein
MTFKGGEDTSPPLAKHRDVLKTFHFPDLHLVYYGKDQERTIAFCVPLLFGPNGG